MPSIPFFSDYNLCLDKIVIFSISAPSWEWWDCQSTLTRCQPVSTKISRLTLRHQKHFNYDHSPSHKQTPLKITRIYLHVFTHFGTLSFSSSIISWHEQTCGKNWNFVSHFLTAKNQVLIKRYLVVEGKVVQCTLHHENLASWHDDHAKFKNFKLIHSFLTSLISQNWVNIFSLQISSTRRSIQVFIISVVGWVTFSWTEPLK